MISKIGALQLSIRALVSNPWPWVDWVDHVIKETTWVVKYRYIIEYKYALNN